MTKKQREKFRTNKLVETLSVATAAAAVGLPASPTLAKDLYVAGGAGIFLSWGSGWDWGFDIHGSYYPREKDELNVMTGASLQVHFMDSSNKKLTSTAPAIVFALHGGSGLYGVASVQLEAGISYRSDDPTPTSDHLGVTLTGPFVTTSYRGSASRKEHAFELGLTADYPNFMTLIGSASGRPLRCEDGLAQLPVIKLDPNDSEAVDASTRGKMAAIWSTRAQQEWASVPAFAQLVEQLQANDAPEPFVRRAEAAGKDEVRHAILAAGMVSKFIESPVQMDPADTANREPAQGRDGLKRLAIESWLDGCLGEGMAAISAHEEAEVTSQPDVRAALEQIARDEHRHAELAWDILAWSLAQGDDVVDAVRAVRNQTPTLDSSSHAPEWYDKTIAASKSRLDALLSTYAQNGAA